MSIMWDRIRHGLAGGSNGGRRNSAWETEVTLRGGREDESSERSKRLGPGVHMH